MNFLDLAKAESAKSQNPVKSTGGKGKKQCLDCKEYVGVRSKSCSFCSYNFETKTPSLFATPDQRTIIEKLNITVENIVQWILMCSYIYYVKNDSLITDQEFDSLISMLKENWDRIEHRHFYLIDKESLENGSLFQLKEDQYPQITRHAALRHLKAMKKFKRNISEVVEQKLYNRVSFNEMVW